MKPGSPPLFFYRGAALQPGDIQRLARRPEMGHKPGKAHHLCGIHLLMLLHTDKGTQFVRGGMRQGKTHIAAPTAADLVGIGQQFKVCGSNGGIWRAPVPLGRNNHGKLGGMAANHIIARIPGAHQALGMHGLALAGSTSESLRSQSMTRVASFSVCSRDSSTIQRNCCIFFAVGA